MEGKKQYLTIRQTAAELGVPEGTIRAWMKSGEIPLPGFYAGTRFYVNVPRFRAMLDGMTAGKEAGI